MTNSERQRRYRERALRDPDGLLLTRLQVMISPQANAGLDRICKAAGVNKREAVEIAIRALEQQLVGDE